MFYHLGTGSGEEEGSGVEEYQEAGGQDHRGLQIQLTAHLYQNITFKSALNLRNLHLLHATTVAAIWHRLSRGKNCRLSLCRYTSVVKGHIQPEGRILARQGRHDTLSSCCREVKTFFESPLLPTSKLQRLSVSLLSTAG